MKKQNTLYFKISITLFILLAVLGFTYIKISQYVAADYIQEINQKLYGKVADSTVEMVTPLVNGEVDTAAVKDIIHSLMVINPSVEVYLLDTEGKIITFLSPNKSLDMDRVNLKPINEFITAGDESPFIKGDNPRDRNCQNIFSAAPIINDGKKEGYIYMILASEEQMAVANNLKSSYFYNLSLKMFFISLLGAFLIGLLAIWLLTKNLRTIIETVTRFKEGDYSARIAPEDKGDLIVLGNTFNEMADEIVRNIDELKSVENLRRELIANVSHDLRTPLAVMQGYVETMLMKNETLSVEKREKYLNTVLGSSERLSKLVSDLFEYSKLEANQIQPQKETFFISELAQDLFFKYQVLAEKKNVSLRLNVEENLPLVFADLGMVERVLQNLMDNALKFTPENGEIQLNLKALNNHIEVKVADNGPGIPDDQQSAIFERYNKAGRIEQKNNGAGLGLAIVKKILELHNATIRVQSRLNEGTTFMFELPVHRVG